MWWETGLGRWWSGKKEEAPKARLDTIRDRWRHFQGSEGGGPQGLRP